MKAKYVDATALALNRRDILSTIGIGKGQEDELTSVLLAEVTKELLSVARPQYCYTIVDSIDFAAGRLL